MDENRAKTRLESLKAKQKAGVPMVCPRCGEEQMDMKTLCHNAFSRHAQVYICKKCGVDEAIRDFYHTAIPLTQWAAILAAGDDDAESSS